MGETGYASAEGATAPETLRQKDHADLSFWKEALRAPAEGITFSGKETEGHLERSAQTDRRCPYASFKIGCRLAIFPLGPTPWLPDAHMRGRFVEGLAMTAATGPSPPEELLRTPLHALHSEAGARMMDFAGYEMPLHYRSGILKEHLHTRELAGLFDVSHMGQFALTPITSNVTAAARALESVLPADILGLREGRQRYTVLTNERGGIIDDLMVARHSDRFMLIVNAARKLVDEDYLTGALGRICKMEHLQDRALLALQGPSSEAVLGRLSPQIAGMHFMDVAHVDLAGISCWVTRSGYSGEDGFEISVPAHGAEALSRAILQDSRATLAGLGARDSLRLEAGLCLYGSDLDESTTPVEAALEWSIPRVRRAGGDRAGGFPGTGVISRQLADGPPRRRVGLAPDGRAPIRAGTPLFAGDNDAEPVGQVTSGGFGPTVDRPIAMAYVMTAHSQIGTLLKAELRGRRVAVRVTEMPFAPHNYKR